MSVAKKLTTIAGNVQKVYEAGQDSVPNPLEYCIQVVFAGTTFPDGYELTLDLPNIYTLEAFFGNAQGIKKLTLKGNKNKFPISFRQAFTNCETIEVVDMTDFHIIIENADQTFFNATSLREIKGIIDLRQCTSANNPFYKCYALEDFRLLPNSVAYQFAVMNSPLLSAETRQSIVEALLPLGGILKLHSDVVAKFTTEQMTEIISKNWSVG